MRISIDEKILEKYGLGMEEFLVLFLCSRETNIESSIKVLIDKGLVDRDLYNNISAVVSDNTKELIASIIIDSDKNVIDKDEEFEDLAKEMQKIFPEGRKAGSTYYWRGNVPLIARKLKTLVTKFNVHFTKEEVLRATRNYVEAFNGDYTFMQLLKYFILKTNKTTGEITSELLTYLENAGQEESLSDNWLNEVR